MKLKRYKFRDPNMGRVLAGLKYADEDDIFFVVHYSGDNSPTIVRCRPDGRVVPDRERVYDILPDDSPPKYRTRDGECDVIEELPRRVCPTDLPRQFLLRRVVDGTYEVYHYTDGLAFSIRGRESGKDLIPIDDNPLAWLYTDEDEENG